MAAADLPVFTPKEPLASAYRMALQGGGVGLVASAIQNSLAKHERGAMGVFTRTGGTQVILSKASNFCSEIVIAEQDCSVFCNGWCLHLCGRCSYKLSG